MSVKGSHGEMGGLLGRELDSPVRSQPTGRDEEQWMRTTALQTEGIPFGFTTYRPSDITGTRPLWYQLFARNYGDIDDPPLGVPMGPRHFSALARDVLPGGS